MGGHRCFIAILLILMFTLSRPVPCRGGNGFRFVPNGSDDWTGSDKIEHFSLATLAAGTWYAVDRLSYTPEERSTKRILFFSVLEVSAMGLALEIFQGFYPKQGSGFSWKDLSCDIAGSIVGAFIMSRFVKYNPGLAKRGDHWERGF